MNLEWIKEYLLNTKAENLHEKKVCIFLEREYIYCLREFYCNRNYEKHHDKFQETLENHFAILKHEHTRKPFNEYTINKCISDIEKRIKADVKFMIKRNFVKVI